MTNFKTGDTVKCIDNKAVLYRDRTLVRGKLYTVLDVRSSGIGKGELHLDFMPDVSWKTSRFELVPTTDFNKSLLKVGMRVVLRDGQRLVTCLTHITDPKGVKVLTLEHLDKSGIVCYATDYDIMEVWEGPELVVDFFDMDKKGALLFKRVEKTAEDLKKEAQLKEAQLKDIAELEARLADLKSKINS